MPALVRHADSYEVWRCLRDRFPRPYTRADAEWWASFARVRDPQTNFAVEADGETVGGIGLGLKGDDGCSAEIGYWLGEAAWGEGMATAAVRALTAYGFEASGLTRIYAVPFANNPGSARVLEEAGYAREGVMRRSAIKGGVVPTRSCAPSRTGTRRRRAPLRRRVHRTDGGVSGRRLTHTSQTSLVNLGNIVGSPIEGGRMAARSPGRGLFG